jgi:hypothetical protein
MMIACFGSDPMGWKWNGVCMYGMDGWTDGWLIDRLEELQCYDIIIRGGFRIDSSCSCSSLRPCGVGPVFEDGI